MQQTRLLDLCTALHYQTVVVSDFDGVCFSFTDCKLSYCLLLLNVFPVCCMLICVILSFCVRDICLVLCIQDDIYVRLVILKMC